MLGGLPTDPNAKWSPPIVSVCSGFHECIWNDDGQVRISSITSSGSKRTRLVPDSTVGAGGRQQVT